jgi:hypothetical protein
VAREQVWQLAGRHAPHAGIDAANPIVIDVDGTLVTAHSDKKGAAATFKQGVWPVVVGRSSTTAPPEPVNRGARAMRFVAWLDRPAASFTVLRVVLASLSRVAARQPALLATSGARGKPRYDRRWVKPGNASPQMTSSCTNDI